MSDNTSAMKSPSSSPASGPATRGASHEERDSTLRYFVDACLGRRFGGGYDFFISYAWSDGRIYAIALADELKERGFRSFLDSEDYEKGTSWKAEGRRILRKSSRLLLVVTEGSLKSAAVEHEIVHFQNRGRPVWPIDIANAWSSPLATNLKQKISDEILRIPELAMDVLQTGPSDATLRDIVRSFNIRRQSDRRQSTFGFALIFFFVLTVVTGIFWRIAHDERISAEINEKEAVDNANRAFKNARAAQEGQRVSEARRLATQGRVEAATRSFHRAVLFAHEALEKHSTDPVVHQTARDILAAVNAKYLPSGPGPRRIGFDGTGRIMVDLPSFSGSRFIWELSTGSDAPIRRVVEWDIRNLFARDKQPIYPLSMLSLLDRTQSLSQNRVEMSGDGSHLIHWQKGGKEATLWRFKNSQLSQCGEPIHLKGEVRAAAVAPDGKWVLTISEYEPHNGPVCLQSWSIEVDRNRFAVSDSVDLQHGMLPDLQISPDGKWVVACPLVGTPILFRFRDGLLRAADLGFSPTIKNEVPTETYGFTEAVFSSNSEYMYLFGSSGIRGFRILTPNDQPIPVRTSDTDSVLRSWTRSADITSDGQWLAAGEESGNVAIFHIEGTQCKLSGFYAGHKERIRRIRISPDGRRVVTSSDDGTARCWDLTESSPELGAWNLHSVDQVTQFILDPSGRWLAVCGRDAHVIPVWDLTDRFPNKASIVFIPSADSVESQSRSFSENGQAPSDKRNEMPQTTWSLSPDRNWKVDWTDNKCSKITKMAAHGRREFTRELKHDGPIENVTFNGGSSWICVRYSDQRYSIHDLEELRVLTSFRGDASRPARVAERSGLEKWNGQDWECEVDNSYHSDTGSVTQPTILLNWKGKTGHPILLNYRDFDVTLQTSDPESGDPGEWSRQIRESDHSITGVAVSGDHNWAFASSCDGNLLIWYLRQDAQWDIPTKLRGHLGPVRKLLMSSDSAWLLSEGDDKTIRVWPGNESSLKAWIGQASGRLPGTDTAPELGENQMHAPSRADISH